VSIHVIIDAAWAYVSFLSGVKCANKRRLAPPGPKTGEPWQMDKFIKKGSRAAAHRPVAGR